MSFASKTSSLQAYNMLVYRNAVHPEFFPAEGRRTLTQDDYEFTWWVFRGGHTLQFQHSGITVTEIVSDDLDSFPERGLVATLPCAGERDHETDFANRIDYVTSIQTETLTDHLYLGTYNELVEHGKEGNCLMITWPDDDQRSNLSMIDVQRFRGEVHVQGYHLRADCGLVLRTQTIFQVKPEEKSKK